MYLEKSFSSVVVTELYGVPSCFGLEFAALAIPTGSLHGWERPWSHKPYLVLPWNEPSAPAQLNELSGILQGQREAPATVWDCNTVKLLYSSTERGQGDKWLQCLFVCFA